MLDAIAAGAHPADDSRRIADHEREIRHIPCDDGAGTHECILSDRDAADDRAVRTQGRSAPDQSRPQLVHPADLAARIVNIGKNHRRAAEDVVFEGDAFIDRYVILDFHTVADTDIRADDHVLADAAVSSDPRILQNMRNVPDACSFPDLHVFIDESGFVYRIASGRRAGVFFPFADGSL